MNREETSKVFVAKLGSGKQTMYNTCDVEKKHLILFIILHYFYTLIMKDRI